MKIFLFLLTTTCLWVSSCGQPTPNANTQIQAADSGKESAQPNLGSGLGAQTQAPVSINGPVLHLLFLGNSYTQVNDLPHLFARLAASGHHGVETDMVAPGGYTLGQHANSTISLAKIKSRIWDEVVLQDQSFMPALEAGREQELNPGVRSLAYQIRQSGSQPLMYLTWGRQKGLPERGFSDYVSMQDQLTKGYLDIAQDQKIPVAPVGEAFRTALGHDASAALWGPDGSHPSVQGTYLAACVFYAVLYQVSPEGLDYTAGLNSDQAKAMQQAAAETVLTDRSRWLITPAN